MLYLPVITEVSRCFGDCTHAAFQVPEKRVTYDAMPGRGDRTGSMTNPTYTQPSGPVSDWHAYLSCVHSDSRIVGDDCFYTDSIFIVCA